MAIFQPRQNIASRAQRALATNRSRMGLEQQFDQDVVQAQDPDQARVIVNPYGKDSSATQTATQDMNTNVALAQKNLAEQPGLDAYTLNPTFYQPMSWDPSSQYQYETPEQQVRTDEMGLDAQRDALTGYRDIVGGEGLTAIDRAAILQSQMQREQELKANQEAILRDAAEQGRGGSLMSFLGRRQTAQGTANMRALDDARMQATALGRKDAATAGMANVGAGIQSAQDAIDRFNTNNRQDVQSRNAEQFNRGVNAKYEDERASNHANVEVANNFEQQNKGANYGQRGAWNDRQDARNTLINAGTNRANYMTGKQAAIEAKRQNTFNNVVAGAGAVAAPVTSVIKRVTTKDDEEE